MTASWGASRTEGASGQHDACDAIIAGLKRILAERDAAAGSAGSAALLSLAAELDEEAGTMRRDLSRSALLHAARIARERAGASRSAPSTARPVSTDPAALRNDPGAAP